MMKKNKVFYSCVRNLKKNLKRQYSIIEKVYKE
jgi:hypothetical protein